jgi:CBS domain-containing protein
MKVEDIMTRDITSVGVNDSVEHVTNLLRRMNFTGVPVVKDDGTLAGIVTEKDIIRATLPGGLDQLQEMSYLSDLYLTRLQNATKDNDLSKMSISNIMSADVVTVQEDDPLERVASLMMERHLNRLPVVKDGRLRGMITRSDLIKAIAAGRRLTEQT